VRNTSGWPSSAIRLRRAAPAAGSTRRDRPWTAPSTTSGSSSPSRAVRMRVASGWGQLPRAMATAARIAEGDSPRRSRSSTSRASSLPKRASQRMAPTRSSLGREGSRARSIIAPSWLGSSAGAPLRSWATMRATAAGRSSPGSASGVGARVPPCAPEWLDAPHGASGSVREAAGARSSVGSRRAQSAAVAPRASATSRAFRPWPARGAKGGNRWGGAMAFHPPAGSGESYGPGKPLLSGGARRPEWT
jgi:hypothetical protein